MATTAIVAEILIVGLQACLWLSALAVACYRLDWLPVGLLKDWAVQVGVIVLAAAYSLGIVVVSWHRIDHTYTERLEQVYTLMVAEGAKSGSTAPG
jgi:hypothetical protein